jgi:hypothetical protein
LLCVCEKKKFVAVKFLFFEKRDFCSLLFVSFFFPSKSNRRGGEQTLECFVSSFPNEDDDDESSDEYF